MLGGIADAMEGAFDALPQPQGADPLTKQITGVEPIGRVASTRLCDMLCCPLCHKALEEPRSAQCSMTPNYEDLVRNYVVSMMSVGGVYADTCRG